MCAHNYTTFGKEFRENGGKGRQCCLVLKETVNVLRIYIHTPRIVGIARIVQGHSYRSYRDCATCFFYSLITSTHWGRHAVIRGFVSPLLPELKLLCYELPKAEDNPHTTCIKTILLKSKDNDSYALGIKTKTLLSLNITLWTTQSPVEIRLPSTAA